LAILAFLFDAEEARLAGEFARWAAEFLRRALPDAREQFLRALDAREPRGKLTLRPDAFAAAQEIYLRVLSPWLPDAQRAAESLYIEASQRFVSSPMTFSIDSPPLAIPHWPTCPVVSAPKPGSGCAAGFSTPSCGG